MYEEDEEPVLNMHQTHCSFCSGPSPCFCQEELSFLGKQPSVGGGGGGGGGDGGGGGAAAICCTDLKVLKPLPFSLPFK